MNTAAPTYHETSSAYALPNDATEHERLEVQSNALLKAMHGKAFHAPINDTSAMKKALDVGCGTGTMTVKLGEQHPSAKIYGADLSAVPDIHKKPDNVEYVQGEIRELVEKETPGLEPGSFSYTYSRLLIFGMTDWLGYLKTLYSLLEPGGWAEVHETECVWRDATGEPISTSWPWCQLLISSVNKQGLDAEIGSHLEQLMRDAGFVEVQVKHFVWPFSSQHWDEHPESDELGQYSVKFAREGMRRAIGGVLANAGKSPQEIDEWTAQTQRDLDLPAGGHAVLYAVCGKKPS